MKTTDTIAAISTNPGPSGIAVVKISGDKAFFYAKKLFYPKNKKREWAPRKLILGHIKTTKGEIIDQALACYMPGPASYTRQDVVEIQTHGGMAAPAAVLDALVDIGVRIAQPGEFTRRAFLLGRIDLVQAEAILDIILAQTKAGLIAAHRQLSGALSGKISRLRENLLEAKALLELNIDFPEEEIGNLDVDKIRGLLEKVVNDLKKLLATFGSGRLYREGAVCVIAGCPNVGKSSLLNILLDKKRAIVTPTPGTTRDAIEAYANLDGIPFRLIDTAGIREGDDPIETEGVKITMEEIEKADIVLLLCDGAEGVTAADREIQRELEEKKTLLVVNKIDLMENRNARKVATEFGAGALAISAKTGRGIKYLREKIIKIVGGGAMEKDEAMLTNARHRQLILAGLSSLNQGRKALDKGLSPELVAFEIEEAARVLGQIIGKTTPDDVINLIFSRFCIGK